jgi:hypothetical protein
MAPFLAFLGLLAFLTVAFAFRASGKRSHWCGGAWGSCKGAPRPRFVVPRVSSSPRLRVCLLILLPSAFILSSCAHRPARPVPQAALVSSAVSSASASGERIAAGNASARSSIAQARQIAESIRLRATEPQLRAEIAQLQARLADADTQLTEQAVVIVAQKTQLATAAQSVESLKTAISELSAQRDQSIADADKWKTKQHTALGKLWFWRGGFIIACLVALGALILKLRAAIPI